MKKIDVEHRFGFLVHDVGRLCSRHFDQHAHRRLKLTRAQCQVLVYLAIDEGVCQAALADTLEMAPIALARLLDRMELARWVRREADPLDRRAYRLYLTRKAGAVLDTIRELGDEVREAALAGLSDADKRRLITLLRRVRRNLAEPRRPGAAKRVQ
ncbi:MAG TPA: MarR family transcriptional regulator [Burkholderiales bacterium]|nr:MarR family transcriptional regulator [Burkholderiales bacterium]